MSDLPRAMRSYMKEYMPLYVFVAVLFVTGVIFGAVMVNALTLDQKQELSRHLGNFFQIIDQGMTIDERHSVVQSFLLNLKWLGLICLLGLSVIGLPFILFLDFLKGVLVGFTVGFIVGEYAWKGMLFALASVVPQNLILIPTLLFCSVTAIAFALHLIKSRFLRQPSRRPVSLSKYMVISFCLAVVLMSVALFETFLSPALMKWVTPLLIAAV
jgi:stage II sporulation protein M